MEETTGTTPPQKTGFLQEAPNNNSSSRLIQMIIIIIGLIISMALAGSGCWRYVKDENHESLLLIGSGVGTFVLTVIIPVAFWNVSHKREENK